MNAKREFRASRKTTEERVREKALREKLQKEHEYYHDSNTRREGQRETLEQVNRPMR